MSQVRPDIVEILVAGMVNSTQAPGSPDFTASEFLSATITLCKRAITVAIELSPDSESRQYNQDSISRSVMELFPKGDMQ